MTYYCDIPTSMIEGKMILDVGAGTGKTQLKSRHAQLFLDASKDGRYYGIDKQLREPPLLNIIEADVREVTLDMMLFDTVLVMHVLEHIPRKDWSEVIGKLKVCLKTGGYLVVACPYNEDPQRPRDPAHVVFNIIEDTMRIHLLDLDLRLYRATVKYPKRGSVRKIVWWFRQFLSGDRFVPLGLTRYSFITFWKKEFEEE